KRAPAGAAKSSRSGESAARQPEEAVKPVEATGVSQGPSLEKALEEVSVTVDALAEPRDAEDMIWGSMIKPALKRRNPGFNERAYGYRSFNDLLKEAEKRGLLKLEADQKSGGYIVRSVE